MNKIYSDLDKDFVILDNILEFGVLKKQFKLYIIKTDFNRADLGLIKKYKLANPDVEFWISTQNVTRERVLLANQIGIVNIVGDPFDLSIVEDFFNSPHLAQSERVFYDNSLIDGSKVVIVDDNALNIELLLEVLAPFSIEIKTFLNPKDVMEFVCKNKVDLFLLDIMMPEISGFDLAQDIQVVTPQSKIVFVSALSENYNKVEGYNIGSCAYIEKPFDVGLVRSQVFNILKSKHQADLNKATKDNFVAMITHDLKTPISAKILALELLLKNQFGKLASEQVEIIQDILNSTKFMQNMTENILSKYKFESGTIVLNKEKLCFIVFIQKCLEDLKYIFQERNQSIKFDFKDIDSILSIDLLQMKRVVHNLLTNSSEHSPKNSEIIINIFKTPEYFEFSIRDFGDGIALEDPNDVFKKYVAGENKHKASSGLGLYICKKIITAHDGEIFVESKINEGSRFVVRLPIDEAS